MLNGLDRFVPFGPDYMQFDGQASEKTFTSLIAQNKVHCERLPGLHIWRQVKQQTHEYLFPASKQ